MNASFDSGWDEVTEERRLRALRLYDHGDATLEADLNAIVKLAADLFDVPSALISLVERERQFFRARVGIDACDTSREVSFCAHAIKEDDLFVVEDARLDARFKSNPLVTGSPFIRFYAGAPLIGRDQQKIGTLCIIDTKPRSDISLPDLRLLSDLGRLAISAFEKQLVIRLSALDSLTGLQTRKSFVSAMTELSAREPLFAVAKVAIDKFRTINAAFGIAAGDELLRLVAQRIKELAPTNSIVGRLAGDEFGILLPGRRSAEELHQWGQWILDGFESRFDVFGAKLGVRVSVGLYQSARPEAEQAIAGALEGALLALQHAKAQGGNRCELFESELAVRASERSRLEEDLRRATERDEFVLHFQPQYRLADRTISGAEALLRWQHPERGLLSPSAFISSLEASPNAVRVGRWIIERAVLFASELVNRGMPLRIGINLFAAQLVSGDLLAVLQSTLETFNVPPALIELEITEGTVLRVDDDIVEQLSAVRDLGIGIAFDDYGTGFASLSLLKRYPLTRLKIDRDFITELEKGSDDAAIVQAILAMARKLGLKVIAEGVETEGQAESLKAYGCEEVQGYLFSKPLPQGRFLDSFTRSASCVFSQS